MASRHLSIRIEDESFTRLEEESRRSGRSRSELARRLLEEGLRMEQHPGIVFRGGPAGRRAGLIGGPDVWEVARVLIGVEADGNAAVEATARLMDLRAEEVRIALRYFAEFEHEIGLWLERVDHEASRAEEAWRREQELLRT